MWDHLRVADGAADRLAAAWADIAADQRDALNGRYPALRLDHRIDPDAGRLEVLASASAGPEVSVATLDLATVERAARAGFAPLCLVAVAMTTPRALNRAAGFPEIGRSDRPARAAGTRPGTAAARLRRELTGRPDVLLTGGPGTGKTGIAATVAYGFEDDGHACAWLDLRDGWAGAESIAWELLRLPHVDQVLVVVNQLQERFSAVQPIMRLVDRLRTEFRLAVLVLATCRPAMVEAARGPLRTFATVPVATGTHLPAERRAREALHWFACLRLFEIQPTMAIAHQKYPRELLAPLSADPEVPLTTSGGRYSVTTLDAARSLVGELQEGTSPGAVVWDYLKRLGPAKGSDLLYRLDHGDVSSGVPPRSSYLAPAWRLLFQLGATLDDYCDIDVTWGDNVGAAVFAAEALSELGHHEQWRQVAGFVRRRWRYDRPGALPEVVDRATREARDFDEIRQSMDVEDTYLDLAHLARREVATARENPELIDFDRFHRTWMLGVLLGFEGSAPPPDRSATLIGALTRTAAAVCHDDGWFYPRRVPWVTARVVLGLCRVGGTYQTSETVRRACDWLKRPLREGGAYGEWWKGGTGSWNRDEATTAMCVTALIRAGDGDTPEVRKALAWLRSRTGEWTKTDREIDLALVLEAIMLGEAEWRSSYSRMLNLLHWATDEIRRKSDHQPDARFVPEGALRAPFAATQLAALVRVALEREAAALLGGPVVPRVPQPRPAPMPVPPGGPERGVRPLPSPARWREEVARMIDTLEERIRSRLQVPGSARRGSAVQQRRYEFQQQLDRCRALEPRLGDRTPPEVLDELSAMGRQLYGSAWPAELTHES